MKALALAAGAAAGWCVALWIREYQSYRKATVDVVDVGMAYCLAHHGVVDVDQDTCDFADHDDDESDCDLRDLGYLAA